MSYKVDDLVRIVRCDPGNMISPYVGSDAIVIEVAPDNVQPRLYKVEVDSGRAAPNRPQFIVREDMLEPDVTEAMIEAANDAWVEGTALTSDNMPFGMATAIYRAMRAARRR